MCLNKDKSTHEKSIKSTYINSTLYIIVFYNAMSALFSLMDGVNLSGVNPI